MAKIVHLTFSTSEKSDNLKFLQKKEKKTMNSIVYKNVLSLRDCETFYLNRRNCDVFFVFHANGRIYEKVPAHKSILAVISTVFDDLFYGATAVRGDIVNVCDTTADVFKEFLQFFYLSTVQLTAKNFFNVMQLVAKYGIENCVLDACSELCEITITLDNICWGYELAILFEHIELQEFCKKFISENAQKIFQSASFLHCESNVLRSIVELDSLECDELTVFDGCLAWAQNACHRERRHNDDTEGQHLRQQLGDIFYEIRFGYMNVEDFYKRYCLYKGLFSLDEFEDIISMIALKGKYQSKIFNTRPRAFHRYNRLKSKEMIKNLRCESFQRGGKRSSL